MITNEYTIYVDMDGVLTNWSKGFEEISGGIPEKEYRKLYSKNKSFNLVAQQGPDWWENLEWMPDGKRLWEFITSKFINVFILSSTGSEGRDFATNAKIGKHKWLKTNLTGIPDSHIILTSSGKEKAKYAGNKNILIDDKVENIYYYINNGGIGICHKSTDDTINELIQYI